MQTHNYAVFIMTHGRANNVITYRSLREFGYTGRLYLVIDTDDEQQDEYIERYGKNNVLIFDKKEYEKQMDTGDISGSMKCVVFARNACFDFAKKLKLDYFIEADDDYFRYYTKSGTAQTIKETGTYKLDDIFSAMFDFLDATNALAVAPAQSGDFIGGANSTAWRDKLIRKCMNLFFCRTDKRFQFYGRINEDVTTYTYLGQQGQLFFTVADWGLHQFTTQTNEGGMTDTYLEHGTYLKSIYSVLWSPSCVKIGTIGDGSRGTRHVRVHHSVSWKHCTPMILNEKWRKGDTNASGKAAKDN